MKVMPYVDILFGNETVSVFVDSHDMKVKNKLVPPISPCHHATLIMYCTVLAVCLMLSVPLDGSNERLHIGLNGQVFIFLIIHVE